MGIPESWGWNDRRATPEAVRWGARAYRKARGRMPTTVYVHPDREAQTVDVDGYPVDVVPCGGMNPWLFLFCELVEEAL